MSKFLALIFTFILWSSNVFADLGLHANENYLLGLWKSIHPVQTNPYMTVDLNVKIDEDYITVTSLCSFSNGVKLNSTVRSGIFIENNTIEVLHNKINNQFYAGYNCTAQTSRTTLYYKIYENTVEIYDSQTGQTFRLVKLF